MTQKLMSLILIVVGAVSVQDGLRLQAAERAQSMYDEVGPDRYMMGLGALLVLAGLALFFDRRPERVAAAAPEGGSRVPGFVALLVTVVVYALAMPWLGYTLATLAFFVVGFRVAGVASVARCAVYGLAASGFSYWLFVRMAGMPLPRGVLDLIPT
ncbi:MAG: tripartite tricarboxylate transporter TctB family protein [Hyphomicrobiaceae bacterium]